MFILGLCAAAICGGGFWWCKRRRVLNRSEIDKSYRKHIGSEDNDDITRSFPVDYQHQHQHHVISITKQKKDTNDFSYVELVDVRESDMGKEGQLYEGFQLV